MAALKPLPWLTFVIEIATVFVLPAGKTKKNTRFQGNYYFKYDIDHPEHNLIARHWEMKRGELIRGGYSFLQPDNRVRTVEYVVEGRKGLRAAVDYRKPPGNYGENWKRNYIDIKMVEVPAEPVPVVAFDLRGSLGLFWVILKYF